MRRLLALAVLLVVSACSNPAIEGNDVSYDGSDGAYTVWEADTRQAPVDATGTTFDGESFSVADQKGKLVLINTWYASCPPCRAEAPDLVAIAEDYPDLVMIGVNTRDDQAAADSFDRTFEIPYPSIDGADGSFIAGLEGSVPLQAVPTTLILDEEGRPAARYIGRIDPDILRGILDDLS